MATVDSLLVKIDASTELLRRELKRGGDEVNKFGNRTNKQLDRMDKRWTGLGRTVRNALGAFGLALSVRAVHQFARSAIAAGDSIDKASKTAGIAAENLQELRFAFGQLAGTTDKEVDESIRRFNRRLGLAIQGMGEAKVTFELMGIAFRDGAGRIRETDDVLEEVLENLAAIESDSVRAARASQVFGEDAGPRLAAALGEGLDAMEALRQATPGVISNENVKLAAELTDEFDKMARLIGGKLTNAFVEAAARAGDFFGLIELGPDVQRSLRIRELQNTISNLEAADATGSLGGNSFLLERARDELRTLQIQQRVTPFADRRARISALSQSEAAASGPSAIARPGAFQRRGSFLSGNLASQFASANSQVLPAGALRRATDEELDAVQRKISNVLNTLELDFSESTKEIGDQWETLSNTMSLSLRSTLSDAFLGIETDFRSVLQRMAADLVASGILTALGTAIGGPIGGVIAGGIASRDSGGPIKAGQSYYSGVPEVFTPNFSGMAIPMSNMGGMTNVYQTVRFDVGLESVDQRIASAAPLLARATEAKIRESQVRRQ